MVNSLAARRGLKRLRTGMLIGSGVLVLLGLAIVLFLSGTLWPSVVAGVSGGAVMLVVSWFTTSKTLESDDYDVTAQMKGSRSNGHRKESRTTINWPRP